MRRRLQYDVARARPNGQLLNEARVNPGHRTFARGEEQGALVICLWCRIAKARAPILLVVQQRVSYASSWRLPEVDLPSLEVAPQYTPPGRPVESAGSLALSPRRGYCCYSLTRHGY